MDRKVKFGDMVLYNLRQDEHDDEIRTNGATLLPAVVTKVLGANVVNLRVFQDSDESPAWRTYVPMYSGNMILDGTWQFND